MWKINKDQGNNKYGQFGLRIVMETAWIAPSQKYPLNCIHWSLARVDRFGILLFISVHLPKYTVSSDPKVIVFLPKILIFPLPAQA